MKSEEQPKDCNDTTWDIEHVDNGAVTYGPDGAVSFEWGYRVTINCWDGAARVRDLGRHGTGQRLAVTDDIEAEIEAYAWDKVYEEAETVVAQVCQPCGDTVVRETTRTATPGGSPTRD